jgi:hypothetical protein
MANLYTVSNVNVGTYPNDSQGDPLRTAFIKINQNLSNVYAYANLAYYNGLGGNGGGGGGNVTNITNYYGGTFEGWPNITTANLSILTGKLANIQPTNLSALANALANVQPVNLNALNNALATVNVTSLTNFTNVINTLTANASSSNTKVALVSNLSANGTSNGQAVYNTTNGGLYIWSGNAWISPGAAFTPTANSISGVEIFNTFTLSLGPNDGRDFNGRQGFYNGNLYIRTSGAWSSYNSFITGSGTPVLSSGIITATELAAGSVIAGKIGAAAISAAEIQANAITASKIAANSIIAGKIDAGVITAVEIAAGAITATAIAANAITADKIEANAITANKIAANAITAVQIAANAVYANAIMTNAITAAQIAANAITAVQLAANSVYAGALMANVITANEIAANAITSVELAANAVYAGAIQAGAITANTIAANAITGVHVGANVITAAMIDSRGLTIRDLNGNILFAAGLGVGFLSNVSLSGNTQVQVGGSNVTLAALTANATPKWLDLKNNAPGFGVDTTGTWTNQSNILLTANLYGMTGTATFAVTAGTATLTATSDPNAKRLFFTNMLTDTVVITATFVDSGTTYTDLVSLYKTYQSNSTPVIYLTDELKTLPSDSSGTVTSFAGITTTAVVYEGLFDVTNKWSFTTAAVGCTITGTNTATVNVTAMSADSATVTFTGTRSGYPNISRIFKLVKAKAGANGAPGAAGSPGTNGSRGSVQIPYGVAGLGAWNDGYADAAISSAGLTKVTRDQVTLYNSSSPSSFSESRFWTGSVWSSIAAYINGGLLVNGTISAAALVADSITSDKIAAGAITASEISAGAVTVDKLKQSTSSLASGYQFSLGYGGIPVNSTQANAIVVASSSAFPVFAGLFESKSGSPALVCATPVVSASYGRDASYGVEGWECEPFIAVRGRDSNYTQQWNQSAILAHGRFSAGFTNYSRINALTSYTGGVFAGKHPPDHSVTFGLDANYTNTASTQITIGGALNGYSRSTAAYSRSGGDPKVVLSVLLNYLQGTGTAGTGDSNFAGQFQCLALNSAVWPSNTPPTTASVRFAQDDSYGGTAAGKAIWVNKGITVFDVGAGALYTNGQTANFTGAHGSLYNKDEVIEPGDIVIDTPTMIHGDINNALSIVTKSTTTMQKAVLGIYVGEDTGFIPFEISEIVTKEHIIDHNNPSVTEQLPVRSKVKAEYEELYNNSKVCLINALGEGLINVCGENGNIEIGDYIVTSSIPGKGMKQSDDLMRNYTVAKSRENVTFSSPTEVKMIACTYHCG